MTRSRILSAALMAAVLSGGVAGTVLPAHSAVAAEKKTVSEKVGKPVQEAQKLLKAGKYREALAQLQQAQAAAKTPFERYVIAATRESAYLGEHDYAQAAPAIEEVIASGEISPSDVVGELSNLTKIYYQLKEYPKVVATAQRYFRSGGNDGNLHLLVIQSYYFMNNYAQSAQELKSYIASEKRAGGKPTEDQLKLLLSCEYKENETGPGVIEALEQLLKYYPSQEYWTEAILTVEKQPDFPDRLDLNVDRLKAAVGIMSDPGSYMNAAQLALQGGYPGDATAFLKKGFAAGVLGQGADAARQKRLQEMANREAASDVRILGQEASAADRSSKGIQLIKLGDAYVSYGRYDDAIQAYQGGIAKGGLDHPDDAQLQLGIAYGLAGQKAQAKAAFKQIPGEGAVHYLGQLWAAYFGVA